MSLQNKISLFVEQQVPSFVREEYPIFVQFLQAYYQWLEQAGNPAGLINTIAANRDVDRTDEQFLQWFRREKLIGIPGSTLADQRLLVKHIRDFYLAKGTEKSYQFLFNILFGEDVQFYYPGTDILRASDGKWQANLVIWTIGGNPNYDKFQDATLKGSTSGALAVVESGRQFVAVDGSLVTEYTISGNKGLFVPGETITTTDVTDTYTLSEPVAALTTGLNITNPGTGYTVGDTFEVINTSLDTNGAVVGRGSIISVVKFGATGPIARIQMTEFGLYLGNTIVDLTGIGDGNATATPIVGAIAQYPGQWLNTDGQLSSNKVLQDNYYYQDFSYVLRSSVPVDQYQDLVLKTVHPAGMLMFGEAIANNISDTLIELDQIITLQTLDTIYQEIVLSDVPSIRLEETIFNTQYDAPLYYTTYGEVPEIRLFGYGHYNARNNPYYPTLYKVTSATPLAQKMLVGVGVYTTEAILNISTSS